MKLNKTETEQVAKNLAHHDPEVVNVTVDQVRSQDYRELDTKARGLAERARLQHTVETRYPDAFLVAYADAAKSTWYALMKNQDNARKAWLRASRGLTADEARAKIRELVTSFNVRGMRSLDDFGGVTVQVERAWGVSATLYINLERSGVERRNPDDESQVAGEYAVQTKLTWSSTGRSLAEAVASVKLYQELIDLGAEIESVMNHEHIVWTYGVSEQTPEVKVEELVPTE